MHFLQPFLGDSIQVRFLEGILLVIAGYLVGKALKWLIQLVNRKLASRTKTSLDNILLDEIARYVVQVTVFVSLYLTLTELNHDLVKFSTIVDQTSDIVEGMVFIAIVLFLGFVIMRIVDAVAHWYLRDVASKTASKLDDELAPLAKRILNLIVLALCLIIILDHYDVNITSLIVSLGVGSLAIALAAQETIANMIAGFVLMIDRPFRAGDRVQLSDGKIGNVHSIGIRSTKIIDDFHVMIILPNAEIVKSKIENYSYPNDLVRFGVMFTVAYGTDLAFVRKMVVERINKEADVVESERTEVRMIEFSEFSIELELLIVIRNPRDIPLRKSDFRYIIYDSLRQHGIEIPFPQRVIHFAPAKDGEAKQEPRFPPIPGIAPSSMETDGLQ